MSGAKDYLSPAEFVQRTGLSEATVRRRLKDGSIRCEQPGGFRTRILIPVDALKRPQADDCLDDERDDAEIADDRREGLLNTNRVPGPRPKWMTEFREDATPSEGKTVHAKET